MAAVCQIVPVQTRRFSPPRDDVRSALVSSIPPLSDGDIVVVTSKVVSIDQGRVVPALTEARKVELIQLWSQRYLPEHLVRYGVHLTVVCNAIIGSAGIDESNADGFLICLPYRASAWAAELRSALVSRDAIRNLGVVITDSRCMPLRKGVTGVAVGSAGFEVLTDYRGAVDLFGRSFRSSQANQPDAIAAAACGVMGEGSECTPAVVIRNWPRISFREEARLEELFVSDEEDIFSALLAPLVSGGARVLREGASSVE